MPNLRWHRISQPAIADPIRDRIVVLVGADWCGTLLWDATTGKVYLTRDGFWHEGTVTNDETDPVR